MRATTDLPDTATIAAADGRPAEVEKASHEGLHEYMPTRKWWAATITAFGALATLWIQSGRWTVDVSLMFVALVVQRAVSYLTPNADTPGGLPAKKGHGRRGRSERRTQGAAAGRHRPRPAITRPRRGAMPASPRARAGRPRRAIANRSPRSPA